MKVGTDGVLLGAWLRCDNARNVLDVGTGSGLIAMMVAQKNPEARIHGIDVSELAFKQAENNFLRCPWSDRLHSICGDFLLYPFTQKFDLIICNPPFFEAGIAISEEDRSKARNASFLPMDDMIQRMSVLLSSKGKVSMILPFDRKQVLENALLQSGLFISKKTQVYPNSQKKANRLLVEFGHDKGVVDESLLVVNKDGGGYTAEHRGLTKDFYL